MQNFAYTVMLVKEYVLLSDGSDFLKKVCIITITSRNFGNRLQNYALQKALEKLDVQSETIFGDEQSGIKRRLKLFVKKIIIMINHNKFIYDQRVMKFERFNRKYINKCNISRENIGKLDIDRYDYFICGSDQIWNYNFGFINKFYFADFAPKNKKISYAASFGVDYISDTYVSDYTKWLSDFKAISVREKQGSEIVKQLTGKFANVVVDPTMLLSKDEWLEIAEDVHCRNYAMVYFLGDIGQQAIHTINKVEREHGLKIKRITNFDAVSPEEFIGLINNSSLVITDSFHACVFSILFDKPFLVFDRIGKETGMGSRISTLLTMVGLERKLPGMVDDNNLFENDYTEAYDKINDEIVNAKEFLKKALEID